MDGVTRMAAPEQTTMAQRTDLSRRMRWILPPQIVLIGASTGGPQALTKLLSGLVATASQLPFCVTLHMPAELMPVIATHVARTCKVDTCVVTAPRLLIPGTVYFAPGDHHLHFHRVNGSGTEIRLKPGSLRDYCKPAVDVMFSSGAASFGARTLAVVLSGMGTDGLAGARAIVAAGGTVIVQDKVTSAVWGMPGAIAKSDLAAAVLTPEAIAIDIIRRVNSARRSA